MLDLIKVGKSAMKFIEFVENHYVLILTQKKQILTYFDIFYYFNSKKSLDRGSWQKYVKSHHK